MKKKTIIIISICVAVAILVTILCILLFGGKLQKQVKNIQKSMNDVENITATISVMDTEVLVYQYIKEVDLLNDNSADITVTTRTLNSSYELSDTTNVMHQPTINRKDLFQMTLEKKYLSSYQIKDGTLTFTVSKENIKKVLNSENFVSIGDIEFTIIFNGKQIQSMKCIFQTASLKDVTIDIIYQY